SARSREPPDRRAETPASSRFFYQEFLGSSSLFLRFIPQGYLPFGPKALISTSTPAGRSSFISASTVSCVGSRISSSRLCVRISNCSRDFLSTCGERNTVYRFLTVGSGKIGRASCRGRGEG